MFDMDVPKFPHPIILGRELDSPLRNRSPVFETYFVHHKTQVIVWETHVWLSILPLGACFSCLTCILSENEQNVCVWDFAYDNCVKCWTKFQKLRVSKFDWLRYLGRSRSLVWISHFSSSKEMKVKSMELKYIIQGNRTSRKMFFKETSIRKNS